MAGSGRSGPDQRGERDDHELAVFAWRMGRPPLCELLAFQKAKTSKPPPVAR